MRGRVAVFTGGGPDLVAGVGTDASAGGDDEDTTDVLGPSSTFKYREKNSSNHRKNSSLSSVLRFTQSILSKVVSPWLFARLWLGGYPLEKRFGGGGSLDVWDGVGDPGMSGREARDTTGGGLGATASLGEMPEDDGSSVPTTAPRLCATVERGGGGGGGGGCGCDGGEEVEERGVPRFQFGSHVVLEEDMLEYLSLVFTTLATPASLAFSAFALSSAKLTILSAESELP